MIIVKKPHTTEKSMKLANINFYTFVVDKNATKDVIAKFVADKFKVSVLSVRTVNIKPKTKMQRQVRKSYQTRGFKKAYVEVKKGEKISIFETPKEEVKVTTGEDEPIVTKEKRDIFRRTKVRVEKGNISGVPTTQRKVITGK